jgi:hypothetical protein
MKTGLIGFLTVATLAAHASAQESNGRHGVGSDHRGRADDGAIPGHSDATKQHRTRAQSPSDDHISKVSLLRDIDINRDGSDDLILVELHGRTSERRERGTLHFETEDSVVYRPMVSAKDHFVPLVDAEASTCPAKAGNLSTYLGDFVSVGPGFFTKDGKRSFLVQDDVLRRGSERSERIRAIRVRLAFDGARFVVARIVAILSDCVEVEIDDLSPAGVP